jgi:hypothetical protein
MAEKKSIIEEALLDIKNIKTALNANTKEILRSVAREEIDNVVKESLNEVYEEEDLETDTETDLGGDADAATADIEFDLGGEGDESDLGGSTEISATDDMDSELTMDNPDLGGDELDMTTASDDDVIAIYKKLSGDDEIEIIGDEIHLTVSEPGEYVIKTNEIGSTNQTMDSTMDVETPEMDDDSVEYEIETPEMDDDSVEYEIEMGGEEDSSAPEDLVPVDDEEEVSSEEEPIEEQIPVGSAQAHRLQAKQTKGVPLGAGADNLRESVVSKNLISETTKKYNNLLVESNRLKAENEEFKQALKTFRKKLVETVVLNSNLSYVTRLFMENATTKNEKLNIIRRFDDEVTSLVESKKLYKTIANELASRKPLNESIEKKIIKEVSTSSSKQLNESTAYVDPSTKRILDLINRVEGRQ